MRQPLRVLIFACVALSLLPATVAAQEATPAPGFVSGPHLGDRVRVEDFDHNEVAAVTVLEIEDPFMAEPGFRLVRIDVVVENVGTEPLELQAYDFAIVDTRGFIYDSDEQFPNFDRIDDPNAEPGAFEPGQARGGPVTIQIPADAEIAQIRYTPSERSIPLVDLRPIRPSYDTPVPVYDPSGALLANIAVAAPTDPYVPPPSDSSFVLTDERYLTFETTILTSSDAAFAIDPRDFYVLDTHGFLTREMPPGELESDPSGPFLQPNDPVPAGTTTGLIKFLLPDDADPVAIIYAPSESPGGDRFLTVAESGLAIPAPTSTPIITPEVVTTPGCEGVVAWLEESFGVLETNAGPAMNAIPDPDDTASLASVDPAILHQAAAEIRDIAASQAASAPPAAAAAFNDTYVALITFVADGYDRIADAVESGDQTAIDAAITDLDEIGQSMADNDLGSALGDLARACPEIEDV